jgi:hypothetical protein
MLLSSVVRKHILKHYNALKLSAAVGETFRYAHPSKEVLNKTTYLLVKNFSKQNVFTTGNKSTVKEFRQVESC